MHRHEAIRLPGTAVSESSTRKPPAPGPNEPTTGGAEVGAIDRREEVALAVKTLVGAVPKARTANCPRFGQAVTAATLREKIETRGERALSNTELLAIILLGSVSRGLPAWKLAEDLLRKYGFEALPNLSLAEWQTNRGVGLVTACQLQATFELGRRAFASKDDDRPVVSSPSEVYAQVRDLRRARKEHLVGLYLDAQNRLIVRETISIGSLNTTRTHPREILYPAIVHSALGFILAHNHPSGSLTPSQDDVDFTRAIKRAAEIMGIPLYDHVIVGEEGFASLKEKGIL